LHITLILRLAIEIVLVVLIAIQVAKVIVAAAAGALVAQRADKALSFACVGSDELTGAAIAADKARVGVEIALLRCAAGGATAESPLAAS
jgi:hypothetical protein